jgi:hypothetical protein
MSTIVSQNDTSTHICHQMFSQPTSAMSYMHNGQSQSAQPGTLSYPYTQVPLGHSTVHRSFQPSMMAGSRQHPSAIAPPMQAGASPTATPQALWVHAVPNHQPAARVPPTKTAVERPAQASGESAAAAIAPAQQKSISKKAAAAAAKKGSAGRSTLNYSDADIKNLLDAVSHYKPLGQKGWLKVLAYVNQKTHTSKRDYDSITRKFKSVSS